MIRTENLTNQLNRLFRKVGDFSHYKTVWKYQVIFDLFIGLGAMLGFDWEQIEEAYISKNEINHEPQQSGY
ncbi:dUTP diphosphatase [Bacillus sp. FSL K6-3431]|uniref:dUTP diphosphatase n=1 Tax=Bacillus sp. FSL K6-3431 TaxID=2921500 RepID=UPI0030F89B7C